MRFISKYLPLFAVAGGFLTTPLLRAQDPAKAEDVSIIQFLISDNPDYDPFKLLGGIKDGLPFKDSLPRKLTFGGRIKAGPAKGKLFDLTCSTDENGLPNQSFSIRDAQRYYSEFQNSAVLRPTSAEDIRNGFPIRVGAMENQILKVGRSKKISLSIQELNQGTSFSEDVFVTLLQKLRLRSAKENTVLPYVETSTANCVVTRDLPFDDPAPSPHARHWLIKPTFDDKYRNCNSQAVLVSTETMEALSIAVRALCRQTSEAITGTPRTKLDGKLIKENADDAKAYAKERIQEFDAIQKAIRKANKREKNTATLTPVK